MRKVFQKIMMVMAVVSFSVMPQNVFSEDKDVQELEEIVVQARKIEESIPIELGEFGHPLDVITAEQIKDSGFVDLPQILDALVPGFFTSTRAGRGSYTYPSIHGSNTILLTLDGIRINNRLYGNSMESYMNFISVHNIERIEVLKSGESLFYGTEANAGVINIVTKTITDETSGEFGVSYGGYEYMDTYGHVTGRYNGHGLMAFGSAEGWDGYVTCNDAAYAKALNNNGSDTTGYDRKTAGVKYQKTFDLAGKASLNAQAMKQQGGFDYGYPNYKSVFSDWKDDIAILKWDHDVNKNFSYYLKSYAHTWWSEATFMKLDGSYLSNAAPWGYDEYGVNLMTSARWGAGHEIISGIDYQRYWGKDDFGMQGFRGDFENVVGFFASLRPYLDFSPKTKLAVGGRYDTTSGTDSTIWDVSMKTPIVGPTYFRSVANTSFTLPNIQQLYGNSVVSNRLGNPDLDPENSFNVEAGLGGNWRYFNFDAGYFYRGIEDMITTVKLANGYTTYKNVDGKTNIQGTEVSAGIGPFSGWSLMTSACWIKAEDKDTGKQLEKIPEFFAKANLQYRYQGGRFGADFMTRYAGDIYERALSKFDDVKYGNYYIADASAFVKFGKENRHRVTLRVENIFNEDYATRYYSATNANGEAYLYNFDGLPRNVVVGYSYTF